MSITDWALIITSLASITSLIVQAVKILFLDAVLPDSTRRLVAIHLVNFLVNLGLLMLVLVTQNKFNIADLFGYLVVASGQSVGSSVGQTILSAPSQPKEVPIAKP